MYSIRQFYIITVSTKLKLLQLPKWIFFYLKLFNPLLYIVMLPHGQIYNDNTFTIYQMLTKLRNFTHIYINNLYCSS